MALKNKSAPLVYSTDKGRICPGCGQPAAGCACRVKPAPVQTGGIVRVGRETKGRKGSGVTVVRGLALAPEELRQLAGRLKKQCGAGGSVKDGVIEIQGEHRDQVVDILTRLGYTVKRAGG